jgi:crossover junction endodeoxyribonuclease RuvC
MMCKTSTPTSMSRRIILGIDPGSRITGFGVIAVEGQQKFYLTSGCIRLTARDPAIKCREIYDALQQIILTHKPEEAAIEQVFMHLNPGGAIKLGQARGAAITAIANHHLSLAEYSARQVKQAVVGYGAAQKQQVQQMVQVLLKLSGSPQEDAADALAIALCHANFQQGLGALPSSTTRLRHGRLRQIPS